MTNNARTVPKHIRVQCFLVSAYYLVRIAPTALPLFTLSPPAFKRQLCLGWIDTVFGADACYFSAEMIVVNRSFSALNPSNSAPKSVNFLNRASHSALSQETASQKVIARSHFSVRK